MEIKIYENLISHACDEVERALEDYNNGDTKDEKARGIILGEYMVLDSINNQVFTDEIMENKKFIKANLEKRMKKILNKLESIIL